MATLINRVKHAFNPALLVLVINSLSLVDYFIFPQFGSTTASIYTYRTSAQPT